MEAHHLIHKVEGGSNSYNNLALMHNHCHDQYHAEYVKLKNNLRKKQGYIKVGDIWIKFHDFDAKIGSAHFNITEYSYL